MSTKVAYLGPEGTYAEQATLHLAKIEKLSDPKLIPCIGIRSVIENASSNECEAAVIPIENSVEGGVTASLDGLWKYPDLFIRRELILPIRHCLLSNGTLNSISEVLSHPQALAQCSEWLSNNLKDALVLPTNSTAEAVRMVKGSKFRAAIAAKSFKNMEDLNALAYPINDVPGNCTRFVLLRKEKNIANGGLASLAFSLPSNSPGSLLNVLNCVANLGLNMNRIESRPSKRELGEYVFFIDIDLQNSLGNEYEILLDNLKPICEHLADFGTYNSNELSL